MIKYFTNSLRYNINVRIKLKIKDRIRNCSIHDDCESIRGKQLLKFAGASSCSNRKRRVIKACGIHYFISFRLSCYRNKDVRLVRRGSFVLYNFLSDSAHLNLAEAEIPISN